MKRLYVNAAVVGAGGLGLVAWATVSGPGTPPGALIAAAVAMPIAVALAVWGRSGVRTFPTRAFWGGATVGPVLAIASHALVAAFVAAFVVGFADSGRALLESLRADPRLVHALGSPWIIVLLVEVVAVAPLTEEVAKALGARLAGPGSAREAFLAGAAAGAGFAAVENVLYAAGAAAFGGPWPAVVAMRALGAAVHPLATGLVVLGWWEWRQHRDERRLAARFLAGAGVHALWNGSFVAAAVVEEAFGVPAALGPVALAFAGALGVVLAGTLWSVAGSVEAGRDPFARTTAARGLAGWIVLSSSLLVPIVVLAVGFPGFYRG